MEAYTYSQSYDSTYDGTVDTDHYEDDETDKNNFNLDDSHFYGTATSRSRRETSKRIISPSSSSRKGSDIIYGNMTWPPSLAEQMHHSSSHRRRASDRAIHNSANNCIENNFDVSAISSAKSIAYQFANPCGLNNNSNNQGGQPMTPSTVCSSFSDESQSQGESLESYSPHGSMASLHLSPSGSRKPMNKARQKAKSILLPRRLTKYRSGGSDEDESRRPSPSTPTNINNGNDDVTLLFVGDQRYLCPSGSMGLATKYFLSQQKEAEQFSYVDLSTHSPEEFKVVMGFLEDNSATATWDKINWKNIHIILPWFVEFQALPLMSAGDTFLLHNSLAGGERGDSNSGNGIASTNRPISLSNLLALTRIAFACGLESTKLYTRRLLRQGLLEPRKQTNNQNSSGNNTMTELDSSPAEAAEDIELEWTLDDLRALAQILQTYDDLREYLWEFAVIVYLPHDLDISDSLGLVSNILFPYLLREGMMQMMIVEGIESSYPTTDNNTSTDSASSFVSNNNNLKTCKSPLGSSFSEYTSCSDTTIPTAQRKKLTDDEMQDHLLSVVEHLEKFQAEKDTRTLEEHRCPVDESLGMGESVDDAKNNHSRRGYRNIENQTMKTSRGRGLTTFTC